MIDSENFVVDLIALHDGKLVGRTRLQKTAYLLDRCGGSFDMRFVYYHYGPYSPELALGALVAHQNERIEVTEKPGRYRIRYAIFQTKLGTASPSALGELAASSVRRLLKPIKNASDLVLEIAATIMFLRAKGYPKRAVEETKARKTLIASDERVERALALLRQLGLEPQQ